MSKIKLTAQLQYGNIYTIWCAFRFIVPIFVYFCSVHKLKLRCECFCFWNLLCRVVVLIYLISGSRSNILIGLFTTLRHMGHMLRSDVLDDNDTMIASTSCTFGILLQSPMMGILKDFKRKYLIRRAKNIFSEMCSYLLYMY